VRSLLDIRLSRFAFVVLAAVSAAATAVILLGGPGRSPAQLAALVALRNRPHAAQTVASVPATTPQPAATSGGSGSGSVSSSPASSGSASAGPAASAPASSASATTPPASSSGSPSTTATTPATTKTHASDLPKVGHVFELMLSAPSYASAFGAHSKLHYLHSLVAKGTLLSGYRTLGSGELADELALVSGQQPNPDTAHGCVRYEDFPTSAVAKSDGLVPGRGCVYPESALTLGDQVTASGKRWGAYVADMGHEACIHPNSDAVDDLALPFSQPGYDTRHNPFIYFHSLVDLGDCATDDRDLSHLPAALSSPKKTPAFTYVAPNACADADPTMVASTSTTTTTTGTTTTSTTTAAGATTLTTVTTSAATPATTSTTTTGTTSGTTTDTGTTTPGSTTVTTPSGCPAGSAAGLAAENAFLKLWIPRILRSRAYRTDGVLVIAMTRDSDTGHAARTGALVLSRWTPRHKTLAARLDPYALLRMEENALRLTTLARAKTAPKVATSLLKVPAGG
jgi:hypothetical protein